jgi:superfamily II DNA/RNA helicase
VQAAKLSTDVQYVSSHKFADFEMHDLLKSNVIEMGFIDPTPIQDQTIPQGLLSQDIVGIANTGTGKTVAFAIPLLHKLMSERNSKAIIMAPTRELAEQIETECKKMAKKSGLFGTLLIGGKPMGPQLRDLRSNPRIVIGTPGRIKDHAERGTLNLSSFNIVVLDEVDRMLDMGFINDMKLILKQLAQPRQSFFFSATMDAKVKTLINQFVHEPTVVSVKTGETAENVEQNVVGYRSKEDKIAKLHDLLIKEEVGKTLVFDETQRGVERLHKELEARGFKSDAIHGGKNQGQRQRALKRFKNNEVKVLVATDVAARGIDVADITHVINYSTPSSYEDYVHRIGRAGRAGRTGKALTFIEA